MAEKVGSIYYDVTLDTSGLIDGSRKVAREVDGLQTKLTEVAKAAASFAAALAIVGVVREAVNAARAYEKTLADLSAITGVTGDSLSRLSDEAKALARSSTASSGAVVEAMKLIASAKPELLETAGALTAVTKEAIALAEASGMQLPAAAEAVTLALNQFGEGADQAARFVNVLAAGAKFGASEIADTAIALKNSAVSAASARVSFEETNAALQALAAGGIKGGEAGTALRNVILKLENDTDKKLKPSIVGLAGALEALNAKNLSSAALTKMFGLENVNAAQALIGSAQAVKTLTGQLTGTNTAYEQAAINTGTLDAAIKKMTGALEMAAQTFGQQFIPIAKAGAAAVQALANDYANGAGAMKTASNVAEVAAAALAGVLGAKLVTAVTGMVTAYSAKVAAQQASIAAELVALRSAEALALAHAQNAAVSKAAALANAEQAAAALALARSEVALAAAEVERTALAAALAAGTQAQAAQTLVAQVASTRLTAARAAEAEATAAAAVAERALSVARGQAFVAAGAATTATATLTTATTAATAATGLAAGAARAFSGVMAALGGPVGIAITALVLLAWNWDSITKKAGDAATVSEDAAARIAASLRKSSDVATKELRGQLADVQQEIADIDKELANRKFPIASEEDLAALRKRRDALVAIVADINKAMMGVGGGGGRGNVNPETVKPERPPRGPVSEGASDSKFDAAGYIAGLEKATLEGVQRVDAIERDALRKNAELLAQGKITRAQAAQATTLIEQEAADQRRDIALTEAENRRQIIEQMGQDEAEQQRRRLEMVRDIQVANDPIARLELELLTKSDMLRKAAEQDRANEEIYAAARVQLEEQTASAIAAIHANTLAGYSANLETAANMVAKFGSKQTALYKTLFAASKAFAIAESIIKIQQGIAGAAALPFPANIPAIGAVVAATSGIISTISGTNYGGGRLTGGPASAGSTYRINEAGAPEMFVGANGRQYMMPTQAGNVVPADGLGAGKAPTVIIQNMGTPQRVESQSYDSGTNTATLVVADLVDQITSNSGPVWSALTSSSNVQGRL